MEPKMSPKDQRAFQARLDKLSGYVPPVRKVEIGICASCFEIVTGSVGAVCKGCADIYTTDVAAQVESGFLTDDNEMARRKFYVELVIEENMRNYKPGWASHKYRDKFGTWPPASFRSS